MYRSSLHHKTFIVTNLGLSDKYPMVFFAGEVALPLHGAIVLAFGLIQYDSHPFPRGKESGANVGNSTPLALPDHLHYVADLGVTMRVTVSHCTLVSCLRIPPPPFLYMCLKNKKPTFGGLPLSTVPALLILLISGLVSWRIWGIQEGKIVRKQGVRE